MYKGCETLWQLPLNWQLVSGLHCAAGALHKDSAILSRPGLISCCNLYYVQHCCSGGDPVGGSWGPDPPTFCQCGGPTRHGPFHFFTVMLLYLL